MSAPSFFDQLWIARYVVLSGLGLTVSISLLAILAGSVVGVFVGLSLTYGNRWLRLVVRVYTDIIRGTPVLVLVLASYYVSSAVGVNLDPFSAGVLALAIFAPRMWARSCAADCRRSPRGRPRQPRRSG